MFGEIGRYNDGVSRRPPRVAENRNHGSPLTYWTYASGGGYCTVPGDATL